MQRVRCGEQTNQTTFRINQPLPLALSLTLTYTLMLLQLAPDL